MKQLTSLKEELASLRTAQVTNGAPSKLNRIKGVRKHIARVLTVLNQEARTEVRKKYAGVPNERLPKDLRVKKTRAIRRRLTKKNTHVLATCQKGGVVKKLVPRRTVKQQKKVANAPKIRFAVAPETN